MASRALKPVHNRRAMSDVRHFMRFMKNQAGQTTEEIARSENVSVQCVKDSIVKIDTYRQSNTGYEMELAVRDFVISTMPVAKETLNRLLRATELVEQKNRKTGKKEIVRVNDKVTQLEGSRLFKDIIIGLQPKGPLIENNITQTNQMANIGGSESNEERFRRLRKMADEHNRLPPLVAGVPKSIDEGDEPGEDDSDDEEEGEDDD